MTATFYVGDAIEVMGKLPEKSVDLILTSPPFLALRSYLPADHPDKALEGGSQATPGMFIDWLVDVVEACDRVLAPHGSLCIELGDTYSGGEVPSVAKDRPQDDGGYSAIRYEGHGSGIRNMNDKIQPGGPGWALSKSLSLIPELFRLTLVYGTNPLTGRQTDRWRLRNVVRWVRPNPPVGALGDKFRPATSELMVFCKSAKRYFDLDAVREPHVNDRPQLTNGAKNVERSLDTGKGHGFTERTVHPAGAPPLDWWNIPPAGYSGFTTRTEKVPIDPSTFDGFSGDIQRTVSADCPEHGDRADQAPKESHDGRVEIESLRNLDIDGRHVGPLTGGFFPTDRLPLLTPEDESSDSPLPRSTPAATRRSKASNRTALAPPTSPPGTPSEETHPHTGDKSELPVSGEPNPGTSENRTSEVSWVEAPLGTPGRIADTKTERSGEACTCSYYVEKAHNTSHYAVFPPELCIKPIKAMCPEKVCKVCGEPSRRIVEPTPEYAAELDGDFMKWKTRTDGIDRQTGGRSKNPDSFRTAARYNTLGFSDCGHDDWRPGLVLDPFGGSGTTALVATGHGRDCVLIDLDERNYDLALERVGPFILEKGEL